ncbi:hypothetical protein LCM10_08025 [Rossellomorea aquimaris]|uniref:hypothetical protein n=1 Tax=Rossellomorea aquimaris TaxID=189382 RepID=UPI001CD1E80C|nr:hypothetical protein [Rossellomorea aquimaris]MCA1054929.1 hypothetical protein [Rossellomorea aquimaris]
MSIASISYGSLKDASGEAKAVARKLDRYADAVYDNVYKKLNRYNGTWSSNLSTAKSKANNKISALRAEANKFEKYSAELIDLKEQCESTDKSVKSRVSSLTASFKDNHGIKNSKVENAIHYFLTSVGNETSLGRWLGDGKDQIFARRDAIKDAIDAWYNVDGGKEFLKGIAVGFVEVVIGVLAIIGAIVTGGALIFIIAGVVAGAIAAINGVANIINEGRGLHSAWLRDDPATGKRRSDTNTMQDYLRKETNSRFWHGVATGIDWVNTVCSVVSIYSSGTNLMKNGYKWATGSLDDIKNISIRDVLSSGGLSTMGSKIKTSVIDIGYDIREAVRFGGWQQTGKDFVKAVSADFWRNMQGRFFNFKEAASTSTNPVLNFIQTNKNTFSSSSNILDVFKGSIQGGFTIDNLFKVGKEKIAFPCVTIVDLPIAQGDPYSAIKVGDFKGMFDKGKTVFDFLTSKSDNPINPDIMNKLSNSSGINISTPDVYIPEVNIPARNV